MIQFALGFDDGFDAELAAETLRSEGYVVEILRSGPAWVVSAIPETGEEDVWSARRHLDHLARSLDGSFLGHGGLDWTPRVPRVERALHD
jgi:hypothetical protein